METFAPPVDPSPGSSRAYSGQLITSSLGDGYEQRTGQGTNTRRETMPLVWDALSPFQADQIEAFFEARGYGVEAFLWQPPGHNEPTRKWKCLTWSRAYSSPLGYGMTAEFQEVHEL